MGYSRKYPPPPPLWTTLNWVPRNFRISKKDKNPADSKSLGIPEFCKILNGFAGIPIKIHKILGEFMEFESRSPSIYYRISNVVHGGCVDIFWNSPFESMFLTSSIVTNVFQVVKLEKTVRKLQSDQKDINEGLRSKEQEVSDIAPFHLLSYLKCQ